MKNKTVKLKQGDTIAEFILNEKITIEGDIIPSVKEVDVYLSESALRNYYNKKYCSHCNDNRSNMRYYFGVLGTKDKPDTSYYFCGVCQETHNMDDLSNESMYKNEQERVAFFNKKESSLLKKIKSLIDKGDEIVVYLPNQKFEELSKYFDNIQWTHGGSFKTESKGFHRKGIFISSGGKDVHIAPLSDFSNICEKIKDVPNEPKKY